MTIAPDPARREDDKLMAMGFTERLRRGPAAAACAAERPFAGRLMCWLIVAIMQLSPLAASEPTSNPLAPPDRSTPQATVRTLLESGDVLARFIADSYLPNQSLSGYRRTREMLKTPVGCLNLEGVAPAARQKAGIAAALNLYEVLSRIDLSVLDHPTATSGAGAGSGGGAEAPPASWTIPNTEITLERTPGGKYLFSAQTVAHAQDFYDRVRSLPYRRDVPLPGLGDLPGTGGGWMVPFRWVAGLPWWLQYQVDGVAIWKLIATLGVLAVGLVILRLVFHFSRAGDPSNVLHRAARRLSLPAYLLAALPVTAYLLMVQVNLVGSAAEAVMIVTTALLFGAAAWLAWRAGPMLAETIIASPRIPDDGIDAHLIRIIARLLGMSFAAGLLAMGADRLGVPLYGVVAGLGVGGLALALSAQPTIENLIGG
jgi:MscS family membrane protein